MKADDIIDYLLVSDTSKLIVDVADSIIRDPSVVLAETFPVAIGIIVLAVDDAKTSNTPASQNPLYLDTFYRAKESLEKRVK